MGTIRIQESPKHERFSGLTVRSDLAGNSALGGRYALPLEFDQSEYASAFVPEGNEVSAAQQDQPVVGTILTSPGWQVWRYPERSLQPEVDDKGMPKKDGKTGETIFQKHPFAGQPHKVAPIQKDGQTLVLMFRPLVIQQQVNEAYGLVSIERMVAENRGETVAGANPGQDPGMIPEERLAREIGKEAEIEAQSGRSAVVHSSLTQTGGRIERPSQRISR